MCKHLKILPEVSLLSKHLPVTVFSLQQMAKVLVALLRFSPKQQKEILRKVDEQANQVSGLSKRISYTVILTLARMSFQFIYLLVNKVP